MGNVDVVESEYAAYDEVAAFNGLDGEIGNLFSEEDLALLAQDIPNNNSAAGGHHDYLDGTLPVSWKPASSSNATESNGIPSINVRPSTPANAANDRGELDVHRFFAPQRFALCPCHARLKEVLTATWCFRLQISFHAVAQCGFWPWHCLNLRPLPQGQGSLRPRLASSAATHSMTRAAGWRRCTSCAMMFIVGRTCAKK